MATIHTKAVPFFFNVLTEHANETLFYLCPIESEKSFIDTDHVVVEANERVCVKLSPDGGQGEEDRQESPEASQPASQER